uniref:Uncharacterized protein n=1 Tax=Anopheles culicifacies TaxID=139723 RepID=A0A182M562_9DIPT
MCTANQAEDANSLPDGGMGGYGAKWMVHCFFRHRLPVGATFASAPDVLVGSGKVKTTERRKKRGSSTKTEGDDMKMRTIAHVGRGYLSFYLVGTERCDMCSGKRAQHSGDATVQCCACGRKSRRGTVSMTGPRHGLALSATAYSTSKFTGAQ